MRVMEGIEWKGGDGAVVREWWKSCHARFGLVVFLRRVFVRRW